MRKLYIFITFILCAAQVHSQIWPASLSGRWTFDNTSDLLHATVGNDLVLTGTHTVVPGPVAGDGAVAIDAGSYYTCTHGIPANGGGSLVNEYSIMFDVMIEDPTEYHCFFQTNQSNSNDGDMFFNTNSQIGISATGYSGFSARAKQWYRVVITVDNGSSLRYYVDGKLVLDGTSQTVDGTYSLDPTLLFFADDNGEDNLINVAQVAIFNTSLTASLVSGLGGFHASNICPYLQTPTPSSMYVSWNSYESSSTIVEFGATPSLGASAAGTYEDISSNRWHTVKLSGLQPDTRYYYHCISGTDTSAMFHFHTPPLAGNQNGHIRFIKLGDNQANDKNISAEIGDTIVYLLHQLYGADWTDSISLALHTGDIVQDGSVIGRYMNEYFNAYAGLSPYIPFMVTIGNHEAENAYYYKFMKYEDLTGFNEAYYTFNLGDCQFIAMNTNGLYNTVVQTNWLQTQLNTSNADQNIDIVFTYNHEPKHSEIWPDGNSSFVETSLYPVEAAYPKMVMTTHGHSHCYERGTVRSTHAFNWDFREVISGGAGGALDRWGMYTNQTDYPEVQKAFDIYNFLLVDVDISTKKVNAYTYSLGNTDKPRNLEQIDRWHRYLNQPAPDKPTALWPDSVASVTPTLMASPFSGVDTLMSSEFQLDIAGGNFTSPVIDVVRDSENYYGDSGSPNFIPINLNNGIDLKRYSVGSGLLTAGQTYIWRMRYRDQNVRWSDWSDTLQFTAVASPADAVNFTADVTTGTTPLTVHFTDLSVYNPVSWQWDFDNNGTIDDNNQDPTYTYTTPGLYTVSLTSQVSSQVLTKTKQYYINVLTADISENENNEMVIVNPNPSNGNVQINFPSEGDNITVNIKDISGKTILTLFNGTLQTGQQKLIWNGKTDAGTKVAPGIYLCHIQCNNYNKVVKIVMN